MRPLAAGTGADADSSGGAVVLSENAASAAVGTEAAETSADEAGMADNGEEAANSADTENGQSSRKLFVHLILTRRQQILTIW